MKNKVFKLAAGLLLIGLVNSASARPPEFMTPVPDNGSVNAPAPAPQDSLPTGPPGTSASAITAPASGPTLEALQTAATSYECTTITQACVAAGYLKNGKNGHNLLRDCYLPIVQTGQRPSTAVNWVPKIVDICRVRSGYLQPLPPEPTPVSQQQQGGMPTAGQQGGFVPAKPSAPKVYADPGG